MALDLCWLEARLEKTDITSLISDFDLLREDEELRLCRDCLRLSSHVLFRDSFQLAAQLLGRMLQISLLGIKGLMEQAVEGKNRPWLRPMTASLTPPGGPLIRTLQGHADWVSAVALTPDGRYAVSGSYDNALKVWDLESGREIRTLEGHAGSVRAVALTHDGRCTVSGSGDKTLKVWDLESGKEIRTLEGHAGSVSAIALTPDVRRAISGSGDNTLKVWDLESGREIRTLEGHAGWVSVVVLTPDGQYAVSGSGDSTLRVWDLESGSLIASFTGESSMISCAIAHDGLTIVAGEASGKVHFLRLEGIAPSPQDCGGLNTHELRMGVIHGG